MTSHREAPSISRDPVADNTDLYAFRDPVDPTKVTLIANYIPLEEPAGGPNFHTFDDNVLYELKIDNDGDAKEDITYQFRFKTKIVTPGTFLYNVGPISFNATTGQYDNLNVRQTYSVTRVKKKKKGELLASGLITPPVNIGPKSTNSYETLLVPPAVHTVGSRKFFAGQRGEGFYVDLGSIFNLGILRPFAAAHLPSVPPSLASSSGVNGTSGYNVHSIAMQVPIIEVTSNGSMPTSVTDPAAVIGVWASASRQKVAIREKEGEQDLAGPFTQVSRLGNPLINEVIIPLHKKDLWNAVEPKDDAQFDAHFESPELQALLPFLYPGVFTSLATFAATGTARADLVAILLTGIPTGIIGGFQNFTGPTHADMLRLNLAIPPNTTVDPNDSSSTTRFGILGGDFAGFPNGRRVFDNVTAIELQAIAGIPGVAPFTPDLPVGPSGLRDGTTNDVPYLPSFPYLATPHQGYSHVHTHS